MNMRLRFPVLGFTAALLAACAAPSLPPPSAAPVQHYLNARSEAPLAVTEQWWRGYHDPLLDRLVQRALDDNLDLQVALARIDAARALRQSALRPAARPWTSAPVPHASVPRLTRPATARH
ncbi:hypothetical protein [Pseudomonas taiwanensis]|uniref:RND transporter n=1 Tax=Pseudomonas taiwanensis SJ9 TaxID=1388762 RepID=V7D236_9PSED|nr:hypothetical protein [Pseudomonas taiwanensis]ESW36394.1 hypothetical protein O164_30035 [Pseudomonas taiwanensis SJ9]